MAVILRNSLIDALLSWERGVDTYRTPARVPRNQLCLSINNTTRQDYITQRPGWRQRVLDFGGNATLKAAFETGWFQGFHAFIPDTGPAHLVFAVAGQLFRVNALTNLTVQQLSIPEARPTLRDQAWFEQAEIFLVMQDGQSKPLIYDGATVRVSDVQGTSGKSKTGIPLREVPVGTAMAYSGGRLWVALPDGRSFVGGDGVYGPTGTALFNNRDSLLRFTENQQFNGGFPFAVPANMGPIRALKAVANLDTSLGQGPLQVFTPSGAFSVDAPFDRTLWFEVTNPIKTVSLLDAGALSQFSTQLVNGDIWYRASDGVRSFLIARRDFGTWGNRSMSYEVIRHLQNDDTNLLRFASAALFDNRLLMTCQPQRSAHHGVYHRGLVVLDFIPLTALSGPEPPCWDGLWTGLDILQIVSMESQGVTHCFAAVLAAPDQNGIRRIHLWELTTQDGHDTSGPTVVESRISRTFETPRLDFSPGGSNRLEQKLLEAADIWVDKVSGTVDFTLWYRPDEYPCWLQWKHWQVCAKTQACASDAVDGCQPNMNLRAQFRARMGALRPPEANLDFINTPARLGYIFQFRLDIVGEAEVTAMRFLATRIVEPTFGAGLPEDALCEELVCCEPEMFPPEGTDPDNPETGYSPYYSAYGTVPYGPYSPGTPYGPAPPPDHTPTGPTIPPDIPPPGNFPVANGWTLAWPGVVISSYAFPKVTDDPYADIDDEALISFWQQVVTNEFTTANPSYSERMFGWYSVDPYFGSYGDIVAKYNTGDPVPHEGDPVYEPGPMWILSIYYR